MSLFYACRARTPHTLYAQPRKNSNIRAVIRPHETVFDLVAVPDFPGWWEGKYYTKSNPTLEHPDEERRGYVIGLSLLEWEHFPTEDDYEARTA